MIGLIIMGISWLTIMMIVMCKVIIPDVVKTTKYKREIKKIKKNLVKSIDK